MKITKTQYVEFCLCPRKAWLNLFKPVACNNSSAVAIEGIEVGKCARDIFGKGKCLLVDPNNIPTTPGIYAEYPLRHNDLECLVDILKINDDNSIEIFEVKSSSSEDEELEVEVQEENTLSSTPRISKDHLNDISFQYYVAIKAGLDVKSVNLVTLNKNYVYDGQTLDLNQLFNIVDYKDKVKDQYLDVEINIQNYLNMTSTNEVMCPFSSTCNKHGGCQYLDGCKRVKNLPSSNNVYDLRSCVNRVNYIEEGIVSFEQLIKSPYFEDLSEFNKRFVIYSLMNVEDTYVNKEEVEKFLKKFKNNPIYFFDFETVKFAIPRYKNSRPHQQIPFQYSLHTMKNSSDLYNDVVLDSNNLFFLGDGVNDPREELIRQMLRDLGNKGKIVAYHKSFEINRIKELAIDFPEYANKLMKLVSRFVDLEDVFLSKKRNGYKDKQGKKEQNITTSFIYNVKMGNSTSIKHVLPAFFPNDVELDYTKLHQVHKGDEASEAYQRLSSLNKKEQDELRDNMLKYCCLDTKAMVALFFKIKELS